MQGKTTDSQDREQEHFNKVIKAFQEYTSHSATTINNKLQALNKLPMKHKIKPQERLLSHLDCIDANQEFLDIVTKDHPFVRCFMDTDEVERKDYEKVKSTIRQFVRDWSREGEEERNKCYLPIIEELNAIYGEKTSGIKVLVPGAGLGRLAFEIVKRGYTCQGNEFSFFMLLGSNFILNQEIEPHSIPIFPWLHQFSNMPSHEIQTQKILIPDVCPATLLPPDADFSMIGGDFMEVYAEHNQKDQWDCIVTCFFIDTAKNFTDYLKVIKHALKQGGKWINLGFSTLIRAIAVSFRR